MATPPDSPLLESFDAPFEEDDAPVLQESQVEPDIQTPFTSIFGPPEVAHLILDHDMVDFGEDIVPTEGALATTDEAQSIENDNFQSPEPVPIKTEPVEPIIPSVHDDYAHLRTFPDAFLPGASLAEPILIDDNDAMILDTIEKKSDAQVAASGINSSNGAAKSGEVSIKSEPIDNPHMSFDMNRPGQKDDPIIVDDDGEMMGEINDPMVLNGDENDSNDSDDDFSTMIKKRKANELSGATQKLGTNNEISEASMSKEDRVNELRSVNLEKLKSPFVKQIFGKEDADTAMPEEETEAQKEAQKIAEKEKLRLIQAKADRMAKLKLSQADAKRTFEDMEEAIFSNQNKDLQSSPKPKKVTKSKDGLDADFTEVDEEGREAVAEFQKQRRIFTQKKRDGAFTQVDEIQLQRLITNEKDRRSKVLQDIAADEPGTLFVSRHRDLPSDDEGPLDDASVNESDSGETVPTRPAKVPKLSKRSKAYKNAFDAAIENSITRKPEISTGAGKGRGRKKKPASDGSGQPKKPRTPRGPRKTPKSLANIGSLMTSNVFADHPGEDGPSADEVALSHRNRNKALTALVASMPEERRALADIDSKALNEAAKKFTGRGSVYPDPASGDWKLKGLKSCLKHYQVLGVSFMRERETGSGEPRGGLVADEMGLGKTVQMLANIVNGLSLAKTKPVHTTLIVVPSALLSQWFAETLKHCEESYLGEVMIYYAKSKVKSSCPELALTRPSIVLTTYSEIARSAPKVKWPPELITEQEKIEWFEENRDNLRGPLHRIIWHRIVLDEAHVLKNHLSLTSQSLRELMGTHKWAISGTPCHNNLQELYPYFRFLGIQTGDLRTFNHNFDVTSKSGRDRLNAMLAKVMLRRLHSEKLLGQPILVLPKPTHKEVWVNLNTLERAVYDIVHHRITERINSWSRQNDGSLERNYRTILTLLLKLRQLVSHVLIVENCLKDILVEEDILELEKLTFALSNPELNDSRQRQLLELRRVLKSHKNQAQGMHGAVQVNFNGPPRRKGTTDSGDANETGGTNDKDTNSSGSITNAGNSHGLYYDFQPYIENLRQGDQSDKINSSYCCSSCGLDPPEDAHITSCLHVYCLDCVNFLQESSALAGLPSACCISCGVAWSECLPFSPKPNCSNRETTAGSVNSDTVESSERRGGKSSKKKLPAAVWITNGPTDILASAKTIAVKAEILNRLEENPKAKIIIYVQFVPLIHIIARVCAEEGWKCLKFYGGMHFEARDQAIIDFRAEEDACILISSIRCGGQGLNLTMAQHVINLDAWWNFAVEEQAFCRVHRIGQTEKTSLTRIFCRETVDRQIYDMQQTKQESINTIFDPSNATSKKMTIPKLLELFGPVGMENGQYIITTGSSRPPMFEDPEEPRRFG